MLLTRGLLGVVVFVACSAVMGASAAAPVGKAPRIVSAAMQDSDRDARADSVRLTYSARVLHHVIPASPGAANGTPVGFSLVADSDGSVRAFSAPVDDFLGLIERGPRGWLQRFRLERQAREKAKQELRDLMTNERVAALAAEIKEN